MTAAMPRQPSKKAAKSGEARFDAAYYERYYGNKRTRVHDARKVGALATGVTGLLAWWEAPLRTVLDVGAGVGHWGAWFARNMPKVKVRSTELSSHACERYGHEQRDISRWRDKERFDLVVCQGVLPYLDDDACAAAIDNLAAMTGGFLYLEAITKEDLDEVCDVDLTDVAVHGRPASFYEARLRRGLVKVGAGLWARKDGPTLFYALEHLR
jgi:SAM-dependent methyltransferase